MDKPSLHSGERNHDDNPERDAETPLRAAFSVATIATAIAVWPLHSTIADYIGIDGMHAMLWTLFGSAGLSVLYLIALAASLKYSKREYVDDLKMTYRHRAIFYDWSVNVFILIPWFAGYGYLIQLLKPQYGETTLTIVLAAAAMMVLTFVLYVAFYLLPYILAGTLVLSEALPRAFFGSIRNNRILAIAVIIGIILALTYEHFK